MADTEKNPTDQWVDELAAQNGPMSEDHVKAGTPTLVQPLRRVEADHPNIDEDEDAT